MDVVTGTRAISEAPLFLVGGALDENDGGKTSINIVENYSCISAY